MYQSVKAKIGEVTLRQHLVKQHLGETSCFAGAPDQKQILQLLKERVANTKQAFKAFPKDVKLSPFLEIGAEKGQRSCLLTSKFNCQGFALDLSLDSLKSAAFFAKKLKLNKMPVLICADAENLPFTNNSFPFVFAFETLHHFPKPHIVLQEMNRVASKGGHIFFSEEPIKQAVNLGFWRRDYNLSILEKILKMLLILPFISSLGGVETKFGVIENTFSLSTWQEAISIFKLVDITIEPVFWGPKAKLFTNKKWSINLLTRLLVAIQGGGITMLAKKEGLFSKSTKDILILMSCPVCKKSSLKHYKNSLLCTFCKTNYPVVDNIYIMLVPALRKKIYPYL